MKLVVFLALIGLTLSQVYSTQELCEGFIPPNDLKIPVGQLNAFGEETGISESDFNKVINRIEEVYNPVIQGKGGRLQINRRWSDSTVNASAQRSGNTYILNMYGGLARHETMNSDGFFIVACHEMGHQIGGAPKVSGFFNNWASNEGQSDYFATFKCFRELFSDEENAEFVKNNTIDPVVSDKCSSIYKVDSEKNICMRGAMAGKVVARFFKTVRKEEREPKFDEPSNSVVSRTDDSHPATQCRMDTYFAGAQCDKPLREGMSESDPNSGTCNLSESYTYGLRPLCWFKPAESKTPPDQGKNPKECPIPIPGFCDENGNPKFPFPMY